MNIFIQAKTNNLSHNKGDMFFLSLVLVNTFQTLFKSILDIGKLILHIGESTSQVGKLAIGKLTCWQNNDSMGMIVNMQQRVKHLGARKTKSLLVHRLLNLMSLGFILRQSRPSKGTLVSFLLLSKLT